ncbi:Uma2 family endonuclease [Nostoc sp. FACHB-152]|uniref:Uma2 family endonuclease n=1 Tax=unclassified Nostoc TaxID=2593658 RepID=UPI00168838EF|nr:MULTISPECIES: Uma2 family endonuclease [unclassified Nostoc]MBD2446977.1 Uma2 family endonuclease [Nostoc sp. FACHB-152]MBD2467686.1 Uma2 family endonuclease [Nostoc sp. FACHB-145]
MLSPDLKNALPSTDELPCSDDTPVDNEDQNLLPNILLFLLNLIWANRQDWYFGVDMGVYHTTGVNPRVPVVPEAFLSLGVERRKGGKSRKSYAVWEENEVVPILTLEMVSHTPGGEYDDKMAIYAKLGVLYYVIYNPEYWRRDQHQPFEVYKLIEGNYQLQIGEPYWMPEIGLGIGRYQGAVGGIPIELLSWYDERGTRYLTSEEQAEQEKIRAEQAQIRAEQLAQYLRSLGIDPDNLPS